MTMPITTTFVRHGKSESNETNSLARKGTPHPNEAALKKIHTSRRRLTPLGVRQAQLAGEWILEDMRRRASVFGYSDRFTDTQFLMSPYVRTMETAYEMGLLVDWRPDDRLCERDWGPSDHMTYEEHMSKFREMIALRESEALFWRPTDGESILQVKGRLRLFFDMLNRQLGHHHVYVSTHGEVMWAARSSLEYWLPDELAERMSNEDNDPQNKIYNCRILQYSRQISDDSTELDSHICRVRLINVMNPHDPKTNLDWQPVRRKLFSPAELRAYIDRFPHYL
jgi:broad specificity phosphatase PhoE